MARSTKPSTIEPTWPETPDGQHAVTEIVATRQGSLSPYGDETEFPWKRTSYIHPRTVINR